MLIAVRKFVCVLKKEVSKLQELLFRRCFMKERENKRGEREREIKGRRNRSKTAK